ncbi:MAG: hypothetical protein KDJ29_08555 [Hyphomicrobiales bacterium]|nr:hypothetical protein [Hyphomicrobiales bacterium]
MTTLAKSRPPVQYMERLPDAANFTANYPNGGNSTTIADRQLLFPLLIVKTQVRICRRGIVWRFDL